MKRFLPYGRQLIEADDCAAVQDAMGSDWLTQGPRVEHFERAFAEVTGARHAVAVANGTAALHGAMHAIGIQPGDEVIVPPLTFTATANCIVFEGGRPVFADVEPERLVLDPASAEARITPRTRAIIAVDYAGHPCDYDALRALADRRGLALVADACHALGGRGQGRSVGSAADLSTFSFHPVKTIATGEGGMVTTNRDDLAARLRLFRSHGITRDAAAFAGLRDAGAPSDPALDERGPWYYEMQDLGYNYRLSDLNCALGLSQLRKLDRFVARRRALAARYGAALGGIPHLRLPGVAPWAEPAWHIFPVRVDFEALGTTRSRFMAALRAAGVGTQVHYIPVHLQPFYRRKFGCGAGLCPVAEAAYRQLLTLPLFVSMTDEEVDYVASVVKRQLAGDAA